METHFLVLVLWQTYLTMVFLEHLVVWYMTVFIKEHLSMWTIFDRQSPFSFQYYAVTILPKTSWPQKLGWVPSSNRCGYFWINPCYPHWGLSLKLLFIMGVSQSLMPQAPRENWPHWTAAQWVQHWNSLTTSLWHLSVWDYAKFPKTRTAGKQLCLLTKWHESTVYLAVSRQKCIRVGAGESGGRAGCQEFCTEELKTLHSLHSMLLSPL